MNRIPLEALIVGDVHIRAQNVTEIELLEQQLLALLDGRAASCRRIVLLGDILHTHGRIQTLAMNRALAFIRALAEHVDCVYILVGNHDYIQNSQYLTQNHWMNVLKGWPKLVIVDHVLCAGDFAFCPYVPDGRFLEALDTVPEWRCARILFAHQDVVSGQDQYPAVGVPFLISGHLHEYQTPQANVLYPGAPVIHTFEENRGADEVRPIIIGLNSDLTIEQIPLNAVQRLAFEGSVADLGARVDEIAAARAAGHLVRVRIRDTAGALGAFKATTLFKDWRAQPEIRLEWRVLERTDAEIPTKLGTFENFLNQKVLEELDENLYSLFLKIGYNQDVDPDDLLLIDRA